MLHPDRLCAELGAPAPQQMTSAMIPARTLPYYSYPDSVTRKLLGQGDPWDDANTSLFYGRTNVVACAMVDSPGWEALAAHAIWLHKGQEVVRLPTPTWRALAAVPRTDPALNAAGGCFYVVVEDGPRHTARRMPGGVVILTGMYVWRHGGVRVAPIFTDLKRRVYLRMHPYMLTPTEPHGVEAGIVAIDRIAANLLRALDDHRLSRLDVVAQHDNRPRVVREADPLRPRVRRLALTADPMAVWSPQRVPAALEPPPPVAHSAHASPCLHAVRQHLALRWVREANATDAEREAAREAGRVRGRLIAVPRTVHPFVRGASSPRGRVTEVTLRGAS